MKTAARYLVLALAFALCLFSSFKADVSTPRLIAKKFPPVVKTENFTADNGVPGSATLTYTPGQVYSSITVNIQGLGNVSLTNVSHSPGSINVDKFEGYIAGPYYEYYVYVTISGTYGSPGSQWRIDSATATSVVI